MPAQCIKRKKKLSCCTKYISTFLTKNRFIFFPFVNQVFKVFRLPIVFALWTSHCSHGRANSQLLPRNAYFAQTSTYLIFGWLNKEDTPIVRGGDRKIWRGKPRLKMGSAAGNGAGWGELSSATPGNSKWAGAGKGETKMRWRHDSTEQWAFALRIM